MWRGTRGRDEAAQLQPLLEWLVGGSGGGGGGADGLRAAALWGAERGCAAAVAAALSAPVPLDLCGGTAQVGRLEGCFCWLAALRLCEHAARLATLLRMGGPPTANGHQLPTANGGSPRAA